MLCNLLIVTISVVTGIGSEDLELPLKPKPPNHSAPGLTSSRQLALTLTGLASLYVLFVIIKSYKSKRLQMILSESDDSGYEY